MNYVIVDKDAFMFEIEDNVDVVYSKETKEAILSIFRRSERGVYLRK